LGLSRARRRPGGEFYSARSDDEYTLGRDSTCPASRGRSRGSPLFLPLPRDPRRRPAGMSEPDALVRPRGMATIAPLPYIGGDATLVGARRWRARYPLSAHGRGRKAPATGALRRGHSPRWPSADERRPSRGSPAHDHHPLRRRAHGGPWSPAAHRLDGATATHVRLGESFAFPVTLGIDVWGCLYLRDARLRSLPPSFALIALPP